MRNFGTGVGAAIRENLPQHPKTIRTYRGGSYAGRIEQQGEQEGDHQLIV
jgi:hypothetical protein